MCVRVCVRACVRVCYYSEMRNMSCKNVAVASLSRLTGDGDTITALLPNFIVIHSNLLYICVYNTVLVTSD